MPPSYLSNETIQNKSTLKLLVPTSIAPKKTVWFNHELWYTLSISQILYPLASGDTSNVKLIEPLHVKAKWTKYCNLVCHLNVRFL